MHAKPGNDLSSLPKGVQEFGGMPFDVRGLIQLAGSRSVEITGVIYPEAVRGIKVYRKGQHVHFFHSAAWHAEAGTVIGEYAIHYADGQTKTFPLSINRMSWTGGKARTLSHLQRRKWYGKEVMRERLAWGCPSNCAGIRGRTRCRMWR